MCATCRNLGVFPFFVDPFIQNVLSLKPCVQISNRFHHWIPRSRSSKLDPMLIGFDELFFFIKKTRRKKPDEKTELGARFFPFRKRHARASRGSKTMPLAEAKPCLSRKKKKHIFFPFPRGTAVPLAKAKPCLSRKQNRASRGRKKKIQKKLFLPKSQERPVRDRKAEKTGKKNPSKKPKTRAEK